MNILDSLQMAIATLKTDKLRSLLTALGLIIGNTSVILLVGVGEGTKKLATEELESFGPNMLYVIPERGNVRQSKGMPKTLVLADAEAIATQVPAVTAVAPQIKNQQLINFQNLSLETSIVGTTPEFLAVRNFQIATGEFIAENHLQRRSLVIVLGADLAKKLFPHQNAIGKRVRLKNNSFEVIGIMAAKGSLLESNQDNAAFIPITTMATKIVGNTSPYGTEVSAITFTAKNKDSVRAAEFQVSNLLRLRHRISDRNDFAIHSQEKFLQTSNLVTLGLTASLVAIASTSLLVSGIGIMNVMLMSVKARTAEIGLRKAVGASAGDILTQFLIETAILALAGGILGTIAGAGCVTIVTFITPLEASVAPLAVVLAIANSCGIGICFGVIPARQAAKLDPIVSLRHAI
ncbi:ABC transporter permease [Myxosarcina sp. GI1]|uniref:ABC transporter permease n=1 Tax=Myxosarcina sp. GI1 TaxID=1541065 RepID=UPI00056C7FB8|nr:ABC transporter permease [Myxosarcina sp. GI1]